MLFRLLLLPLWIATHVSGGRMFDVYVNANTGKVIGQRPYSLPKIAAAVLLVSDRRNRDSLPRLLYRAANVQ